ncbi:hypothetical protein WJX73_005335 [Symbiochloris irregularis]|uniref:Uncharacterized protein n=1 Tax=Symbiochloris irregularis TaxID=706552 RepID=A0AAW1PYN1_9CHLO
MAAILLPLLGIAALGFALLHPSQTLAVTTTTYGFISTHPVVISAGVLVFLAVTLSPYLLVLGFAAALFSGIPYVPGPLRPLIPAPLLQAETSLADFSARIRGQASSEAKDVVTELDPRKQRFHLPEFRLPFSTMLVAPDMADVTSAVVRKEHRQ